MSTRDLQALEAQEVDALRPAGLAHGARELKGWFTVEELAEKLRFTITAPSDPLDACRHWLRRKPRVVGVKRGRRILVSGIDDKRRLRQG